MMIVLTEDGQQLLERYLQQIRTLLRGCRSVDPADVERDVMEHIERELHDAKEPVASAQLDPVLKRLGDPGQWIPKEELPWWRRVIFQLRTGPEDYRLAYLSLGLFLLGFSHPVFWIASFLLSRAVLEITDKGDELRGQRWLFYPALIFVYLPLLAALIFWPIGPLVVVFDGFQREITSWFKFNCDSYASIRPNASAIILGIEYGVISLVVCAISMVTGLWWFLLGMIPRKWPDFLQVVFRPFADRFDQKWAKRISLLGLAVCLVGIGGLLYLMDCCKGGNYVSFRTAVR